MPLIKSHNYNPKLFFKNGHFNTIFTSLFRKLPKPNFKRIRIDTPDGDFLDLDTLISNNKRLMIICHGLEGSSSSQYVQSLSSLSFDKQLDVIALNFRSCSGVPNRLARTYHSGDTSDLEFIIKNFEEQYESIYLTGFSLGGNVVLKYLGEDQNKVHHKIKKAVAVSTPCHLESASRKIMEFQNRLYEYNFLKSLKEKVRQKAKHFPEHYDVSLLSKTKTVFDFDDHFTSKVHGFKNAIDYYTKSSSLQFLKNIKIPTLIITALDDPFLGEPCYPFEIAKKSDCVYFLATQYGGHVGFYTTGEKYFWSDKTITDFIDSEEH